VRFLRTRLAGHERSAIFREPVRLVRERVQRLDIAREAMDRAVRMSLRRHHDRLAHAVAADRMAAIVRQRLGQHRERLAAVGALLQTLSPEATLARGYSITFDAEGHVVRSTRSLESGSVIRSRFADGEAASRVIEVMPTKAPASEIPD
jgi:exodeoxyribonuclease VII large subunit